jgi:NADPH:quinone reductase-like Zn-dependent oxidoreductase
MKAITWDEFGAAPALRDVDDPAPGDGEVLVRVRASSANPVDNAIAAGMLNGMVDHEFPVVLGRDYAGTVEAVGSGVTGFAPGDDVFGFIRHADPTIKDGSWAELIVVAPEASIAAAPAGVDVAAAGAAPLAGITALAALDALGLQSGDTLLIVGATGGVGTIAAQIAAQSGITVIAPGLAADDAYLSGLGVAERVDRDGDVAAAVRERHPDGVDGLLDLVSYQPDAYSGALKDGARVASPNGAAGEGEGRTNLMALPTPENLARLADLLADGTVKVPVAQRFGLADAPAALQALAGSHTQGKVAIQVG